MKDESYSPELLTPDVSPAHLTCERQPFELSTFNCSLPTTKSARSPLSVVNCNGQVPDYENPAKGSLP